MEPFTIDFLLSQLRKTRLQGFHGAQPYANIPIQLVHALDTDVLTPAQNFVLTSGVEKMLQLRAALLVRGVDIFALSGGIRVITSDAPSEQIPVIPPIVEESCERDGRTVLLINDGMHRCYAARSLRLSISVVIVRNVPIEYPYYAYALDGGWSKVTAIEKLPDGYQRKEYRNPRNYKALFRDFNSIFPGVQKDRGFVDPGDITT